MLENYEKRNSREEEIEAYERATKLMNIFYSGVADGSLDKKLVEEKQKEIDLFVASLYLKKLDPTEYRLYYVLMGQEPEIGREYKFDTPSESAIDPYGAGAIQLFIEKHFSKINK